MALITCDFFSEALEVGTTMNVVLPQRSSAQIGVEQAAVAGPPPVLYLLHGLSDDHSAWVRYTSIERYATESGLAVVMPAVGRSFYANEAQGHRYWDFVSEELPTVVADFFAVSSRPEDTFVAGLSMGGYGALKLGVTHPDRYAAAASMSGALDLHRLLAGPDVRRVWQRVFGGEVRPHDDLYALLRQDHGSARRIPLWIGCGTEDELVAPVQEPFIAAARAAGHEVTTDLGPGEHEWGLWDRMVREVIDWLPRSPAGPRAAAASSD
jgi:S-formylglutathione hydrolase FrmB